MSTNQELRDALSTMRQTLAQHIQTVSDLNEEQVNHTALSDNPHRTNKSQVGLDSLENYALVTDDELASGDPIDRYMTPQSLAWAWNKHAVTVDPISVIRAPVTLSPKGSIGDQSLMPVLRAVSFAIDDTLGLVFSRREYEVDLVTGDFTSPIWQGDATVDTHITVGVSLVSSTQYQWRCRDHATTGEVGDWSIPAEFETLAGVVLAPSVSVPAYPKGVFNITVGWSGTAPSDMDSHLNTTFQVALDEEFDTLVYDRAEVVQGKTLFTMSQLSDSTPHYVRAKVAGSVLGESTWSSVVAFTTGISDAQLRTYTTPDDLLLNDSDGSVLGGESVSSPGIPFVVFRDEQGGIEESFSLGDLTSDGSVVAVTRHQSGHGAVIYDRLTEDSVAVYFNTAHEILWTKKLPRVNSHAMVSHGDALIVVGSRDNLGTSEAVVICIDASGDVVWANIMDGDGGQVAYGACLLDSRLFVCGRQASVLGSTTATEAGFVVEQDPTDGSILSDRSFGGSDGTYFTDVVMIGSDVVAVGQVSGIAAAVRMDASQDLVVTGHRQWMGDVSEWTRVASDGTSLYLAGQSATGHVIGCVDTALSSVWLHGTNQVLGQAGVSFTDYGLELQTTYTVAGQTQGALVRLPTNGSVDTIPDALEYQWLTLNVAASDTGGVAIIDVGEWGEWSTVQNVATTSSYNNTTPTSDSFMPDDTLTERYQSPQWVYQGSSEQYGGWSYDQGLYHKGSQVTQGSAFIINGGQYGYYQVGGENIATYTNPTPEAGYPASWPQDSDTEEYILNAVATPISGWSSLGTLNLSMPVEYWNINDFGIATSGSENNNGDRDVRNRTSLSPIVTTETDHTRTVSYEGRSVRMDGEVRRRTRTYYGRRYSWSAQYQMATRTYVDVTLVVTPLIDLGATFMNNPLKTPVQTEYFISNF